MDMIRTRISRPKSQSKPMVSIIVAIAENGAIGLEGDLIYHISSDLRRFRSLTVGNTVLMGRKTFQSLPKGALPNRRNIVLSRNPDAGFPGAETYSSLEDALRHCTEDEHVYVIGGAEIYRQALPIADELELTLVHDTPAAADTFFPDVDMSGWEEVYREDHPAGVDNAVSYSFVTLRRRS